MAPPELRGPRVRLVGCLPEHRQRLRELHLIPEIRRWWQDPAEDFPEPEPDTTKYTVLLGDEIAGFAEWYEEPEPDFHYAGIDLFIDPALQHQGLGTETMRVLCSHLIDERGFHRLIIDPDVGNEIAIALYEKIGFKPVGVMRQYARDRHGEWRDGMLLDLLADELVRG